MTSKCPECSFTDTTDEAVVKHLITDHVLSEMRTLRQMVDANNYLLQEIQSAVSS